jgi:hypothetical protein
VNTWHDPEVRGDDVGECRTCRATVYRVNMTGVWYHANTPGEQHDPIPVRVVNPDECVPGRRYEIELDDCCIQGELEATFVEFVLYEPPDAPDPCGLRFDIGTLEPMWGSFTLRELLS